MVTHVAYVGTTRVLGRGMEFDELYNNHHEQVRKTVARYLRTEEDIDDVTQDVFVKAWIAMDSFRGNSDVSTWLTRIAMNESINYIRATKKERGAVLGTEPKVCMDNPERTLSAEEGIQEVQHYLDSLKPVRLEALIKRELEGKSFKVVSKEVSTPLSTVKTWVRRDREHIKSIINPIS